MRLRCRWILFACAFGLALDATAGPCGCAGAAEIRVVVSPQAAPAERSAAEELAGYLHQIYPQDQFALGEQLPSSGRAILVGSTPGDPRLRDLLAATPTGTGELCGCHRRARPAGDHRRRRLPRGGVRRVRAVGKTRLRILSFVRCHCPAAPWSRSRSTAGNWPIDRCSATAWCSTGTTSSADVPPGTCRSGRRGRSSRRNRATTP